SASSDGAKPAPAAAPAEPAAASSGSKAPAHVMPAAQRIMAEAGLKPEDVKGTGKGGRILKEDAQRAIATATAAPAKTSTPAKTPAAAPSLPAAGGREERRVPMSPIRQTIARRLVQAQHNAALLTTLNEVDMSGVKKLREQYQDAFTKR